jgi:hypothetical protein
MDVGNKLNPMKIKTDVSYRIKANYYYRAKKTKNKTHLWPSIAGKWWSL